MTLVPEKNIQLSAEQSTGGGERGAENETRLDGSKEREKMPLKRDKRNERRDAHAHRPPTVPDAYCT